MSEQLLCRLFLADVLVGRDVVREGLRQYLLAPPDDYADLEDAAIAFTVLAEIEGYDPREWAGWGSDDC